eukprot:10423675-Lingulodinium_polyedra.AAC.1
MAARASGYGRRGPASSGPRRSARGGARACGARGRTTGPSGTRPDRPWRAWSARASARQRVRSPLPPQG